MLFIFFTKEVLKLDKSIDCTFLHLKNIPSILVTEDVIKLLKFISSKSWQL